MNHKKSIQDYEMLKAFYFRRKNMINEKEFQNMIFNLKYSSKERLLNCELLKDENNEISITEFGMTVVEIFMTECDNCGEAIFFNAFVPKAICSKCGSKITAEYEVVLDENMHQRKYKDMMN